MANPSFRIAPVRRAVDLAATVDLFRLYAASLDIDLAFQDFEGEMAAMPGKYAPPAGELLLARDALGAPAGCIGLRALAAPGCCEMKRLDVAPAGRGGGLGRALIESLLEAAARIGYREMRLDTLPTMTDAARLYRRLGFAPIAAYDDTPIAETLFMARRLEP
jgi:GNAT superfamily N-acetyltransferase